MLSKNLGSRRLPVAAQAISALLAGAVAVTGFAPFELFPLPIFSLALLFALWRQAGPGRAALLGWLFGIGFMGGGVFWLHVSIDQFGNVGLVFAVAATALFVLFIAGYFALAGWLSARLPVAEGWRLVGVMPAVWGLVEWLRGWFLSGFPWLSMGYSQIDTPLAGYAPLIGVFGMSWLSALSAALLLALLLRRSPWRAAGGLVAIWLGGVLLQQQAWVQPLGEPVRVSMVQANIPQADKWKPSLRLPSIDLYSRITEQQEDVDLVIWPETAIPAFFNRVEEILQPFARRQAERGVRVLAGVPVMAPDKAGYYNAAVLLDQTQEQAYFKRHLVPFGEFLPFKDLLGPLLAFMQIPMSDFSAGQADKPLVEINGHAVGVSICYEDAFGREVAQALPEAAYLINLSNDAWFGDSLAPHQHLQIARMRALETGRPMLRATNTGISAFIGADGGVQQASALLEFAVLNGRIQPMRGSTPFVRWGTLPLLLLLGLSLGIAVWRRDTQ